MTRIHQHQLSNGLWLLAEPVAGAQSLAMTLLTPGGVAQEPADRLGLAGVVAEMICRGAGDRDARAHSDALDQLGVDRSTRAGTRHLHLRAVMLASVLDQALPLLVDMVRRPVLAEEALAPARDLAIQSLDALEDEPQDKVFIELRGRHYPSPLGRSSLGRREHIQALGIEDVRRFVARTFVPGGSVLGFAGRFDWPALRDAVEHVMGDWQGACGEVQVSEPARRGHGHQQAASTQVHIGVAYDAVAEPDPASLVQHAAVAVLSGGMSGRLFTEVREKRGLCYAVGAHYAGDRDRGAVLTYAGTTVPRAQETLDVMTAELRRLREGVAADEFARAIVGMKSSLVMQGESTSARAAAIALDQYQHGRPRSLDELAQRVDAITLAGLNAFLRRRAIGPMTVVTIGPSALQWNEAAVAPADSI